MAVKLNDRSHGHARSLIQDRQVVLDDPDEWSEHPHGMLDGLASAGRWTGH